MVFVTLLNGVHLHCIVLKIELSLLIAIISTSSYFVAVIDKHSYHPDKINGTNFTEVLSSNLQIFLIPLVMQHTQSASLCGRAGLNVHYQVYVAYLC